MLSPVIQEETTGCGIAAAACVLGQSYAQMKTIAHAMGISAQDEQLWSDTQYVRRLLASGGVRCSATEIPFQSWQALPDLALLPIKHHQQQGREFWHWVVFQRVDGQPWVLDSASYLAHNLRQDFDAMQPHWFIALETA